MTGKLVHTHEATGSSSISGESSSSDEDTAYSDGNYWKVGEDIPGAPSYISRHRDSNEAGMSGVRQGGTAWGHYIFMDKRSLQEFICHGKVSSVF